MASDSPVLLCNTGVYMFPDMMAPIPGSYVGVVLSSELPQKERELFQNVLSQLTDLRVQVSCPCVPSGPTSETQGSAVASEQVWWLNLVSNFVFVTDTICAALNIISVSHLFLHLFGIFFLSSSFFLHNRLKSRILHCGKIFMYFICKMFTHFKCMNYVHAFGMAFKSVFCACYLYALGTYQCTCLPH